MGLISTFSRPGSVVRVRFIGLSVIVLSLIALTYWLVSRSPATTKPVFPARRDDGFVSSTSCVSCHPDQHSSWHDSFHRQMTQPATVEAVVAPFDDRQLQADGFTARLQRRGDEFWVNTVDPAWEKEMFDAWSASLSEGGVDPFEAYPGDPPRIDAQIVMTTGAHHFQAYWIRGSDGHDLWQFPWRFHIGEQRWVHRKDVFLAPPEWRPGMWSRNWNQQCSLCHSTGPYPGTNPETGICEETKVVELGIACESCHGPGAAHVQFHRDSPAPTVPDPIVNPAKLTHQRSAEVCGSCHSHFRHSDPEVLVRGPQFRPGKNLYHFGTLREPTSPVAVMSRFWRDGTNRSGGREFSGLSRSACFLKGEAACVNCHSMHDSDPNDQLSRQGMDNEACFQCHESYRGRLSEHTHHAPESSGSQCYNCHMPHTNYALFKAIRSHQIDVPRVVPIVSNSRPNACNLCHLDQTLAWTADNLEQWYGTKSPTIPLAEQTIAAGQLWALRGDAGQRVIAAWHFGWGPARKVSGEAWMVPTLTTLMKDPYAAVRWVAFDALRKEKRFAGLEFEFDAEEEVRHRLADQALDQWKASAWGDTDAQRAKRLLMDSLGQLDFDRFEDILSQRDDRLMSGVE